MPTIQFSYGTEEELCQLLRTTLDKLPKCESLPDGLGLVRQLKASSKGLPRVSITVLPSAPTVQPVLSPTSPTAISVDDPDNPFQVLISEPALPPLPPFPNEITVVDDAGKVTRQRKVPLDLNLIEALQTKSDTALGAFIGNLSHVAATLLRTSDPTISASLARSGKTTVRAVHLGLLLPILKIASKPISNQIAAFLAREADLSLLEGDINDLDKQVEQLDKGVDIPFIKTASKVERDLFARIRGNLEILKIEQQEEF